MLWLKFNIYSLLLTFIAICFLSLPVWLWDLCGYWSIVPAVLGAVSFFNRASSIFQRYQYKVETFNTLVEKLKNKYDLRYCQPYMDTACMRCVIYFSLREIGKQQDYRLLKRRMRRKSIHGNPRSVSVKSVDGKLVFVSKDVITGESETI